jgi:uncharacterized protein (DUF169 family)
MDEKCKQLAEALDRFIRPQTFPLAIKMVAHEDEFPAKTRRPVRDMGFRTTICVAMAMTRKYGWTVGLTSEDNFCPVAALFYGWAHQPAENVHDLFEVIRSMNYAGSDDALQTMITAAEDFRLQPGRYDGIVFSPLESGRIDPDLVMIFGNSAQMMRLVHAATRETGCSLESVFSGRFGACNEGVLQTLKTGRPHVALPGNGDRVWGMVQDDELIFTIPGHMLEQVAAGLEATHRAGVRYPIPVDVRHVPNFPPQLRIDI